MTITAKYNGKCIKCNGQIEVGEQIDWQKGKGASHVACPKAKKVVNSYCLPCDKGWSCANHTGAAGAKSKGKDRQSASQSRMDDDRNWVNQPCDRCGESDTSNYKARSGRVYCYECMDSFGA